MFNPRDFTPAQLRVIREIGGSNIRLYEIHTTVFNNLLRKGALERFYLDQTGCSCVRYRLTPEALAWAKEQNDGQ